jgi:hypothetical protein
MQFYSFIYYASKPTNYVGKFFLFFEERSTKAYCFTRNGINTHFKERIFLLFSISDANSSVDDDFGQNFITL